MTANFQEICNSIDRLKAKSEPIFVWFLGPSGSGKSFFLRKFVEHYNDKGTSAEYSDGAQMLREIKEDISQQHHRPTQEGFIVTNPKLDEITAKKLADSIQNFRGDYCFIEFSGGKDKLNQRNLSYKRINQHFSNHIIQHSIFIYINCPLSIRMQQNRNRGAADATGNSYKVDLEIMDRLFSTDDFDEWKPTVTRPISILDNS